MSIVFVARALGHERFAFRWGLLLLLLYAAPYLLLGQDAYLTIHDFLDDSSYNFRPLALSGQLFNFSQDALLPNIMNGLPRSGLHSGLNVSVALYSFLPPFIALITNYLLVHLIGYLGMFALLRRYFLTESVSIWLTVGVSLGFSFVPVYTNYGLSVMGQPALLLAFLNLLHRRASRVDWLLIVLFAGWSFLVRSGLYVLTGLTLLGLIDTLRQRQINGLYWLGVALLTGLYLTFDFPMIVSFVTGRVVSHRVAYDFAALGHLSTVPGWKNAVLLLWHGHYHAGWLYTPIIALLWLGATLTRPGFLGWRTSVWLLGVVGIIVVLHGIYPALLGGVGSSSNLFKTFQADRFYFLLPLVWSLILALSLSAWPRPSRWVWGLLIAQIVLTLASDTFWRRTATALFSRSEFVAQPSYRAFFAERQFAHVRQFIGYPVSQYRVASLGIHPIVAQHNGFYTLDSYQNNYPLVYKQQFRRLIAPEVAKNPAAQTYFDAYGNRCYLVAADWGFDGMVGKKSPKRLTNWLFPSDVFRSMGGRYVLSAGFIPNAEQTGLHLLHIFDDPASYWRVYLYGLTVDAGSSPIR